ncbi:uncharacterized protein [Cicer arietinum]|uniref:Uncharacterized protein LOC105851366 n=1 Tax=Cicer arietinum TaxID=3827 RepID=A0A1S3DVW2_CICAR|nr:uncharacterized protein LOC105851366 [Cicer arietinum]
MESFFYTLHVSHDHDSILAMYQHIPYLSNNFYIDFDYTNTIIEPNARNTVSLSTITMKNIFVVPREILCNCMERDHIVALYRIFSSVPTYLIDSILPKVEQCARQVVANNDVLKMNLSLRVTTKQRPEQIEDLIEKMESKDWGSTKLNSSEGDVLVDVNDTKSISNDNQISSSAISA